MNFLERANLLESDDFHKRCKIALCDWINYWVNAGVDSIEDETLRANTFDFCHFALADLEHYSEKITALIISQDNIINLEEVTDNDIKIALDRIMAQGIVSLI